MVSIQHAARQDFAMIKRELVGRQWGNPRDPTGHNIQYRANRFRDVFRLCNDAVSFRSSVDRDINADLEREVAHLEHRRREASVCFNHMSIPIADDRRGDPGETDRASASTALERHQCFCVDVERHTGRARRPQRRRRVPNTTDSGKIRGGCGAGSPKVSPENIRCPR